MPNREKAKRGFSKPNTVPTPDEFFDIALRECTGAEVKILAVILSDTYHLGNDCIWVPLSRFQKKTNLSKQGVIDALNSLEKEGWISSSYRCPKCGYVQEKKFSVCSGCGTKLTPARLTIICTKEARSLDCALT